MVIYKCTLRSGKKHCHSRTKCKIVSNRLQPNTSYSGHFEPQKNVFVRCFCFCQIWKPFGIETNYDLKNSKIGCKTSKIWRTKFVAHNVKICWYKQNLFVSKCSFGFRFDAFGATGTYEIGIHVPIKSNNQQNLFPSGAQ